MTHSLNIDWTEPEAAAARDLEVLWVTFVKVQRVRTETMADLALDATDANSIQSVLRPIAAELCRLALAASNIAANCREDIEYKAVMLAEFLAAEDATVQTELTKSLVKDIKNCRDVSPGNLQCERQLSVVSSAAR